MKIDILRINGSKKEEIQDIVTEEIPLTIYLEEKELVTILCSPNNLKELSIGFLYSSGLIRSMNDIEGVTINSQNWTSYVKLKNKNIANNALDLMHRKAITSDSRISSGKIVKLMRSFQERAITFKKTGGVHSAALSDEKGIVIFEEDIGRHNAIDKIIGEALAKDLNMSDLIVLTSGRITSEIVFKIQKMGSAFLISRSAPTDQAIKAASAGNLTLVGFVRGERMNVYTASERLI